MGSALPDDLGDPLLNTFILGWDADRFLHGLKGLWDAPFYFPRRDTLAYSEHLLGIAIFTAPVQWLTGNPVLAYNVAHLGSYVLAGAGMYLLARSLWGRADAAWVAAMAFACAPVPRGADAAPADADVRLDADRAVGAAPVLRDADPGARSRVFAAAFILQALSNGYFLYFFAVPVAVVVVAEAGRATSWDATGRLPRGSGSCESRIVELSVAAAAILAALAPVAAAYIRVRERIGTAPRGRRD